MKIADHEESERIKVDDIVKKHGALWTSNVSCKKSKITSDGQNDTLVD